MFGIDTDGLRSAARNFDNGSEKLYRNAYEISETIDLISEISSMRTITSTLLGLQDEVRREAGQEQSLYETGVLIAKRYDDSEEEIISNIDDRKFDMGIPHYSLVDYTRRVLINNSINIKVLNEILQLFN